MNKKSAFQLWKEFHTPDHVRRHCEKVAMVGKFLAQKLKAKEVSVDPEVVEVAGLVHDVVRVVDFKKLAADLGTPEDQKIWKALRKTYRGKHHADVGAQILMDRGESELADIVRRHKYGSLLTEERPSTWEAKLLYYADKRVAHDQVVSLKKRVEEGHRRHYPDMPITQEEKNRREAAKKLEKEIFKHLDFKPGALGSLLESAGAALN